MASVVVNGDTSGAVTLSAPAVAGTVTVTLPSTSGTMAVGGGTITTLTTTSDITVNGLTVGRGGAGGAANTAYGASAIPIAPNSGVVAIGSNAGKLFNTASDTGQSTFVGYFAGASCVSGTDNTFIGGSAGTNTTGSKNTAVGSQALQLNTTASNNTAVGYQAGYSNTTGAYITALGYQAGYSSNYTGGNAFNAFLGDRAGYSTTTGISNTFVGSAAGYDHTTGTSNTFVGSGSGNNMTTGSKNTIVGKFSGNQGGLDIRTASNYIVLSDGDGNPRGYFNNSGSGFFSGATVDYPGSGNTNTGIYLESAGQLSVSRANTVVARFNRNTSDGTLLSFARDGTEQGTISVSGGTVSYNAFAGSHWSQLSDGSKPNILRGTVLESINELIQWPNEPTTERLCKVKVSDTAGSKKVYGVFMDWDNDWTATNDMYVTAVGAFVCRINASVTVQEGDLLESNGDGTARVQADDIIRSSTIGKVTCTEKTHQYDDGSYCVPTVLYCG